MNQPDNFMKAYQQLHATFGMISGGYYEPKSDRDRACSLELGELLLWMEEIMTTEERKSIER